MEHSPTEQLRRKKMSNASTGKAGPGPQITFKKPSGGSDDWRPGRQNLVDVSVTNVLRFKVLKVQVQSAKIELVDASGTILAVGDGKDSGSGLSFRLNAEQFGDIPAEETSKTMNTLAVTIGAAGILTGLQFRLKDSAVTYNVEGNTEASPVSDSFEVTS
jgi:hypothetical protein